MAKRKNSEIASASKNIKGKYASFKDDMNFCVSEETATYEKEKPFIVFYKNLEHSIRLLKGNCIDILNLARENSVDMTSLCKVEYDND